MKSWNRREPGSTPRSTKCLPARRSAEENTARSVFAIADYSVQSATFPFAFGMIPQPAPNYEAEVTLPQAERRLAAIMVADVVLPSLAQPPWRQRCAHFANRMIVSQDLPSRSTAAMASL